MSDASVPEDVRQFLTRYVRSIGQLEILLQLNAAPQRWWTPAEMYKAVLSNEELVGKTLESFVQLGLIRKAEPLAYQFSPSSKEVEVVVRKLADLYRERPIRVVQAIYEAQVSEIEEFAKAFRLRKDT